MQNSGNTITSNTTTTKVGLLRLGELMAGQDPVMEENKIYWTLTPKDSTLVRAIFNYGVSPGSDISVKLAMKPALNLKSECSNNFWRGNERKSLSNSSCQLVFDF